MKTNKDSYEGWLSNKEVALALGVTQGEVAVLAQAARLEVYHSERDGVEVRVYSPEMIETHGGAVSEAQVNAVRAACQIALLLLMVAGFILTVYEDIDGRPPRAPKGRKGVIESVAIYAAILALAFGAGLFDWLK